MTSVGQKTAYLNRPSQCIILLRVTSCAGFPALIHNCSCREYLPKSVYFNENITTRDGKHHGQRWETSQPEMVNITARDGKHHCRTRETSRPHMENITARDGKHHGQIWKIPRPDNENFTAGYSKH